MSNTKFCNKCHLPVHNGICSSVDDRVSDYVCYKCGSKYLTEQQKSRGHISTYHEDNCGLCGEFTSLTSIRNFNYLVHPDYKLSRERIRLRKKEKRKR